MLNTKYEILNQNQRVKVKMQNDRAKFKNQFSEAFLHFDLNCSFDFLCLIFDICWEVAWQLEDKILFR